MINITITGDIDMLNNLQTLKTSLKDFTVPLTKSSDMYLNVISQNFKDEGQTFGEKWQPLSPVTIAIKRKLYEQGKSKAIYKPLVRTGKLRDSFDYRLSGKINSMISNAMSYAKLHQEGGHSTFKGRSVTVPRRVLAKVDEIREKRVLQVFDEWINQILRISNLIK